MAAFTRVGALQTPPFSVTSFATAPPGALPFSASPTHPAWALAKATVLSSSVLNPGWICSKIFFLGLSCASGDPW